MTKEKKIIVDFLNEIATQNNRSTAFPIYYTIQDKKAVRSGEDYDYAEKLTKYQLQYDDDYEQWLDYEQYITFLRMTPYQRREEYGYDREIDSDWDDESDICYEIHYFQWEEEHKGMFLTEKDAKAHLESNYYHYHADARTYVHHAWRAPYLEEFIEALFKEYDIDLTKLKR